VNIYAHKNVKDMFTELNEESCLNVLANAGPILRYRTTTEILGEKGYKVENLRDELLSCDLVLKWLSNLRPRFDRNMHGSASDSYANAMGKLYDFGLRRGVGELDARVQPYLELIEGKRKLKDSEYMGNFYFVMVAGFLAMVGYSDHEGVIEVLTDRLDRVYDYVRHGDLSDFYVSPEGFKGIPKAFRNQKLVNPKYYDERGLALPTIYDLLGFLHSENLMNDSTEREKVEDIVKLILSEEYQTLPEGYGYVWKPPKKYYAMGWSIHVPLFMDKEMGWRDFSRLLLYLGILKKADTARNHPWYNKSMKYLSGFIDQKGVPLLPSKALPEKKVGYWVGGMRMGLEPGRRTRVVVKRESAFRLLSYLS
jgi:hypothetical protein